jgi:starch synthase
VRCREALLEELDLETPERGRLLVCIGRLAEQKGWDVLIDAAEGLVADGTSLVALGEGEPAIAGALARLARRWPRRVAFRRGWDDAFARRLYAGADALLIPSRFEPCGLVQRVAQRYGALPVAHGVGGLCDTIDDDATGILFAPLSADSIRAAVERAAKLVRTRGDALTRRLMREDVSWSKPAACWETELRRVAAEAGARM